MLDSAITRAPSPTTGWIRPSQVHLKSLAKHAAHEAFHNSRESSEAPKCLPGTRIAILDDVYHWAAASKYEFCIQWIYGTEGSGKSTLLRTLAEMLGDHNLILAGFFFSEAAARQNTNYFIPTIAYQIVCYMPSIRRHIDRAIRDDPLILSKSLEAQAKALIVLPITQAHQEKSIDRECPRIIIIDGLDQCEGQGQQQVLQVLNIISKVPIPIAFLIASRPEPRMMAIFNRDLRKSSTLLELKNHNEADKDTRNDDELCGICKRHFIRSSRRGKTLWELSKYAILAFASPQTHAQPTRACSYEIKLSDLAMNDILIAFMGPTGSGKSAIIDHLTNAKKKRAGSALASRTEEVAAIRVLNHPRYRDRIVLVDTPGPDGTDRSEQDIFQMIVSWLQKVYERDVPLAGIIFLHCIQDNRLSGTSHQHLRMFGRLCGENPAKKVLLASTYWDVVPHTIAEDRESHLKTIFWNRMIEKGASVGRFYNDRESAQNLINMILEVTAAETLLIQEGLVNLERKLNESSDGKELYWTLKRLLSEQKQTVSSLAKQAGDNRHLALTDLLDKQLKQIQSDLDETLKQMERMGIPLLPQMVFFARRARAGSMETRNAE